MSVREAELAMERRLGAPEDSMLVSLNNLADTYHRLGRFEQALQTKRDVYLRCVKLNGENHEGTLTAAGNYATGLFCLKNFEEGKSLMRKIIPVAQRVLGGSDYLTITMRWNYVRALYEDPAATRGDLREAVATLEDTEPTARRVFGGAHPLTTGIEKDLRVTRAALRARETPPASQA